LSVLAVACVEETPALFVVQNSVLDDNCRPVLQSSAAEALASGVLDLTIAHTYLMFPKVENLMAPSGSVSLGGGSGVDTYEGNRVTVRRAEVSLSGPADFSIALPKGVNIPISGTIEPDGEAIVQLEVVNPDLGRQLATAAELADRGSVIRLTAEVKFFGVTTSGTDVESNTFVYPVVVCRGCLLQFPPEASDPLITEANCRAPLVDEEGNSVEVDTPCYPGQDDPVDCRLCRILLTASGETEQEIIQSCEPSSGN